ncbi:MAG: glycosyltransferase [Butyrivibrio sp.]|nr:glycosyltransferase [Butyrivibrio sp.]
MITSRRNEKILFAIDGNIAGGAERQLVTLANSFCRHGYDVTLVNSDTDSDFYKVDERIKLIKMGVDSEKRRSKRLYLKYKNMKTILEKTRPDAVVVFLFNMELPTILACLRKKIPVYTSIRCGNKLNTLNNIFGRLFYNRIAGVVFQTETTRKKYFFPKISRYDVIPNAIPLDVVEDSKPIKYGERTNWIISAGRLVAPKNQSMLIRVFERIADEDKKVELHIFGEGILKDKLKTQARLSRFSDRIFLDGVEYDVMKKHRDAKAFAFTSLYEGYPNALIEAMANGIPVITTNFSKGLAAEIIKDGINGYVCEDEDAYVIKLKQILNDASVSDKLAANAKLIMSELNEERIFGKWEQFLFLKNKVKSETPKESAHG